MLLNKLARWIVCGFFLIPTVIYASTKITVDPKKSFAYIEIAGRDAKNLWEYLKKIEGRSGFILGDATMNASTLRSPVMSCMKSRYGNGVPDKDPSLYHCNITLGDTGLSTYP